MRTPSLSEMDMTLRTTLRRPALFAVAASALALTVAACATPTPYGPMQPGRAGGYAEQRLEANRF
ncbi:MAG TPA: hypothetical protein DCL55_13215, partial [Brevundimonas sp.]|nr:hypothetical protein [Brevundimonas sp.]